MPRIAEIRDIDGDVWVRVGKPGEFPDGITLWTPEERKDNYLSGIKDAIRTLVDLSEEKTNA